MAAIATLGLAVAASANAAPVAPNIPAQQDTNIVQAAWGCGWGAHPNRWGHCVRNRYGYYGHRHYYGGGYYPYWRHRHWYGY